jgi:hypothetical protein
MASSLTVTTSGSDSNSEFSKPILKFQILDLKFDIRPRPLILLPLAAVLPWPWPLREPRPGLQAPVEDAFFQTYIYPTISVAMNASISTRATCRTNSVSLLLSQQALESHGERDDEQDFDIEQRKDDSDCVELDGICVAADPTGSLPHS